MKKHLKLSNPLKIKNLTSGGQNPCSTRSKYAGRVKTCILTVALMTSATVARSEVLEGTCGATDADCHYVLNTTDGTLTITGSGAMNNFGFGYAPWSNRGTTIKSVSISGVITIGSNAFTNCTDLTTVTIPSSVNTISGSAFNVCIGLTTINVEAGNTNYTSENGILFNANQTTLVKYPSAKTGTPYTIPSSVTTIGECAFDNCRSLRVVNIPSGVNTIGNDAFNYCTGLTSVTIPSSVTAIGNHAFYYCIGLTSVTIPSSVITIGGYAFRNCTGLTSVYNYAESPHTIDINFNTFQGVNRGNIDLYVPAGKQAAYAAAGWTGFKSISEMTTFVSNISLNKNTDTIVVGARDTLTASITPADAQNQNVSWISSNSSVVEVNSSGDIRGMMVGTAVIWGISIENNTIKDSCVVVVVGIPVTGVSLDNNLLNLSVGDTRQLTTTVSPSNATNKNVTWSSSNSSVASVSSSGLVTAVAEGTAVIWAVSTENAAIKDSCVITVVVPVTGVSLNITTMSLEVGGTSQLTAAITPNNATNQNVEWSSSNTAVASVSSGMVTAVGAGTATIKVRTEDGGYVDSCVVVVVVPVTGVSLDNSSLNLAVGGTRRLTATVSPSNATNKNVTWTSGNTSVASVNSSGVVTAVAAGTATITVTTADGGYTAQCVVTVSPKTAIDAEALHKLAVYPNPAMDMLYVTDDFVGLVEIYDLNGTLVLSSTSNNVNVGSLPSGVYVVKAGGKAAKIVKQ